MGQRNSYSSKMAVKPISIVYFMAIIKNLVQRRFYSFTLFITAVYSVLIVRQGPPPPSSRGDFPGRTLVEVVNTERHPTLKRHQGPSWLPHKMPTKTGRYGHVRLNASHMIYHWHRQCSAKTRRNVDVTQSRPGGCSSHIVIAIWACLASAWRGLSGQHAYCFIADYYRETLTTST
jgi:hypothetical protein